MQTISTNELYAKGWTIRQASKAIGRSYSHVAYVLRGERKSAAITRALLALPQRGLSLRSILPVSGNLVTR